MPAVDGGDKQPTVRREGVALLSHALMATWQERSGRVLTAAAYVRAGRIDRAAR
ncbi:nSTAND1 domain-containing NTPase [Nocardia sp. NPDC004278]